MARVRAAALGEWMLCHAWNSFHGVSTACAPGHSFPLWWQRFFTQGVYIMITWQSPRGGVGYVLCCLSSQERLSSWWPPSNPVCMTLNSSVPFRNFWGRLKRPGRSPGRPTGGGLQQHAPFTGWAGILLSRVPSSGQKGDNCSRPPLSSWKYSQCSRALSSGQRTSQCSRVPLSGQKGRNHSRACSWGQLGSYCYNCYENKYIITVTLWLLSIHSQQVH